MVQPASSEPGSPSPSAAQMQAGIVDGVDVMYTCTRGLTWVLVMRKACDRMLLILMMYLYLVEFSEWKLVISYIWQNTASDSGK